MRALQLVAELKETVFLYLMPPADLVREASEGSSSGVSRGVRRPSDASLLNPLVAISTKLQFFFKIRQPTEEHAKQNKTKTKRSDNVCSIIMDYRYLAEVPMLDADLLQGAYEYKKVRGLCSKEQREAYEVEHYSA